MSVFGVDVIDMKCLTSIILTISLLVSSMIVYSVYASAIGQPPYKENNIFVDQSKELEIVNQELAVKNSKFDVNETAYKSSTYSEPAFIFDNRSRSGLVRIYLHSFWDDSFNLCNIAIKCSPSTSSWKNGTSLQISTRSNNSDTLSGIYGQPIIVKTKEKYQIITHMKLNQWAKQSQVSLEGFNETSNIWYQITGCPSGIDGPLEWKEFSCVLTIQNSTTKIRPVLSAGWSSQSDKEAITWFDSVYIINLGNPFVTDPNLKIDVIAKGLDQPTSMAFLGPNDILFLQKHKGTVREIVNGTVLREPLLDVNVANYFEMGMLGIAVQKNTTKSQSGDERESTYVFLYFTSADQEDGGKILGNRLYRYELVNNRLVNPTLLLQLPSGVQHDGGKILIGPDKYLYLVVGEVDNKSDLYNLNKVNEALNYKGSNANEPDGRGGILKIDQNGETIEAHGILGDTEPLNKYYAYGIRNSFGIGFDPVTGNLWDTENGPEYGDEINLVKAGFNSGWNKVQGIWQPLESKDPSLDFIAGNKLLKPEVNLVDFNGSGKYSPPEFTWNKTVGSTAIKFVNSDKLGKAYENDLFVGDINNGNIYHFDLSEDRTELLLEGALNDKIADNDNELDSIVFAGGLNISGIGDLQVGPDGYLYVVSFGRGEIYRIMPNTLDYISLEYLERVSNNARMNPGLKAIDLRIGNNNTNPEPLDCIKYDLSTILVTCKSANLSDIYTALKDPRVLHKVSPKIWFLNANLSVENGSTFYINSTDTDWLKINSTDGSAHFIKAQGNLIVDSVKVTGWDTKANDYPQTDTNGTVPRSYIITRNGNGTTNITNSEIAYLGYNHGDSFGLIYNAGSNSILKNNKIHDLFTGFSSRGNVNNITLDNNEIYNNVEHGIYFHDGTHNLIIKSNIVHNNAKKGIFCSTDCYNIVIESNKIYNSTEEGIMMYKNISNSIIKNNILYNNRDQIAIYESSTHNDIYNNTMTGGKVGIRVTSNSTQNMVHNNNVMNSNYGIYLLKGASDNVIVSNRISNTTYTAILIQDSNKNNNIFKNNILLNNQKNEINQLNGDLNNSSFINNTLASTH